jgi:hypothetical protein
MMNRLKILLMASLLGGLGGGSLSAGSISIIAGGETDTLSITLLPLNGAVDGVAGATVGWGYTVDWEATSNLIFFTGSSVGSETNNSIMVPGSYTDFTGGTLLGAGITTQAFDNGNQFGGGSYQISSDPLLAIAGAEDTGQLTFDFDVLDAGSNPILASTYSGDSTAFSVTVDAPTSETPEPGSVWLFGAGLILTGWLYSRRLASR